LQQPKRLALELASRQQQPWLLSWMASGVSASKGFFVFFYIRDGWTSVGNKYRKALPFVASQELICACIASCAWLQRALTSHSVVLAVLALQGAVQLQVIGKPLFGEQYCAFPVTSLLPYEYRSLWTVS
jgi:hypothetical protein